MDIIEKYKNPSEKDICLALDLAVKAFERKDGGYLIEDTGVIYCNYMTKKEWSDFYNCMSKTHKDQFIAGSGGHSKKNYLLELEELQIWMAFLRKRTPIYM